MWKGALCTYVFREQDEDEEKNSNEKSVLPNTITHILCFIFLHNYIKSSTVLLVHLHCK